MKTAYAKGLYAETLATMMLRVKGYKILKTRYKTRFGEIDIIASKKNLLAFIEVKARKDKAGALEAVSLKSQERIANAARFFLSEYPDYNNFDMRFDVISVIPGKVPNHHKNMWST